MEESLLPPFATLGSMDDDWSQTVEGGDNCDQTENNSNQTENDSDQTEDDSDQMKDVWYKMEDVWNQVETHYEIGELFATSTDISVEWRIPNILSLPKENDDLNYSPYILLPDSCWFIDILFDGDDDFQFKLLRCDSGPEKTISFTLSIRKADGTEEVLHKELNQKFTSEDDYCEIPCLKRSELLNRQSELAPSGVLTIIVTLRNEKQRSMRGSLFNRLWKLSCTLNEVLSRGESTDVVLKLKTSSKLAHSVILKSRSTVLKKMLNSGMYESKLGVIELDDEDEPAFDVVLSYMYSGEPKGLYSEIACEVYKTAHKYDLQELKKLCCDFIEDNLTLDSIYEAIALCHSYEEAGLKECAKGYFAENAAQILKTEKWKTFRREEPELAFELLEWIVGKQPSEKDQQELS